MCSFAFIDQSLLWKATRLMLPLGFRLAMVVLGSTILFLMRSRLSSLIEVKFTHILHSANAMADTLAKQGEDRISPFVVFFFVILAVLRRE